VTVMAKNSSFLPDDYLEKRKIRRTNILCLILFIIVMAGIGSVGYLTYQKQVEVRQKQAQVNNRYQKAKKRLEQVEELQKQKQQMIHKARVTSALVERVPRSTLLAELINHMPASLSVLELDLSTKVLRNQPKPTTAIERKQLEGDKKGPKVDVKPKQLNVKLVGVAPTDVQVSEYMTALGQYPLFADIGLQYSEQMDMNGNDMRKFGMRIKIANDINMQKLEPTKIARELKQNPMRDEVQINSSGEMVPVKNVPETDEQPSGQK
jgi:hypothetical protein